LSDAVISLIQNKNDKLPIIIPESDKILYILTYKCILNYLKMLITEFLSTEFAFKFLEELKISIYANTAMPQLASFCKGVASNSKSALGDAL
ncbi:hypothetical protein MC885_003953, partial [Smutsia gigantea]